MGINKRKYVMMEINNINGKKYRNLNYILYTYIYLVPILALNT